MHGVLNHVLICMYVYIIGTVMLSVTPSTTVTTTPPLQPPGKMHVYHCRFSAYTCTHV